MYQPEISPYLKALHRPNDFNRLQLDNEHACNKQVYFSACDSPTLIDDVDHLLGFEGYTARHQLDSHRGVVSLFWEAGAQLSMHLNCSTNYVAA